MEELAIDINYQNDNITVVSLKGFLDAHTFEQLDEVIQELLDNDKINLIVNLENIEYISSAGVGVFIGALAYAQEIKGAIVLVNPAANVREVFDLLGLSTVFTILDSIEDAHKFLAG